MYKAPTSLPMEMHLLVRSLKTEFLKIERANTRLAALELLLTTLDVAPEKPREGLVVIADGTNWDPGSGVGMYRYNGSAWVHVG